MSANAASDLTTDTPPQSAVPKSALWLGGTGAIPFVGCAVASAAAPDGWQTFFLFALTAYGALILSFLGGIQWGLAISKGAALDGKELALRLCVSVVPSLIGWGSLLVPQPFGTLAMVMTFIVVLLIDLKLVREGLAPAWYPKLRWPLTLTVSAALLLGTFA
ncbi:DUF3429 domain-containing protein [Roseibium denhamense]|uniref:DUF3429 domain-containing protein n=1 Tax=Roseibium denhamense TaxID=76305 RepID=A0ABY1PP13_9HYPH|nr:DUF3429 domain-containing protein [Roseibium denhamense]SMP36786.1 Protein of unknown function [Roseibium denhamense]